MQKIENVNNPVLGKYYQVPYGLYNWDVWHPIIPIKHIDKKLAPHIGPHYHLDLRFDSQTLDGRNYFYGATNEAFLVRDFYKVKYKKRKLKHLWRGSLDHPEDHERYTTVFNDYIGQSCKGKICPHKGARMIEVDGKLICPMHNLIGCPKNEIITGYGHTPYYVRINSPLQLPEGWAIIRDMNLSEYRYRYFAVRNGLIDVVNKEITVIGMAHSILKFHQIEFRSRWEGLNHPIHER